MDNRDAHMIEAEEKILEILRQKRLQHTQPPPSHSQDEETCMQDCGCKTLVCCGWVFCCPCMLCLLYKILTIGGF